MKSRGGVEGISRAHTRPAASSGYQWNYQCPAQMLAMGVHVPMGMTQEEGRSIVGKNNALPVPWIGEEPQADPVYRSVQQKRSKRPMQKVGTGSHIHTPTPAQIAARVKAAPKRFGAQRMTRNARQALNSDDEERFSEDEIEEDAAPTADQAWRSHGGGGAFRCLSCFTRPEVPKRWL